MVSMMVAPGKALGGTYCAFRSIGVIKQRIIKIRFIVLEDIIGYCSQSISMDSSVFLIGSCLAVLKRDFMILNGESTFLLREME